MAVAPEAEALVRGVYDALNRKDIRTALDAAHPDVTWPNGLDGTRVTGLEHVAGFIERQLRVIDLQFEVQALEEDPDRPGAVVARVRQVVTFLSDGAVVSDDVEEHIFQLRDGRIVSVDARDRDGNPVVPPNQHATDA